MSLQTSSSQTVGPYLKLGLEWLTKTALYTDGNTFNVKGVVFDAHGPVPDAMIEVWQANAKGEYDASTQGFARLPTNDAGDFSFTTSLPGAVAAPQGGMQAPHFAVHVFARGLLKHLVTRMYFPEQAANAQDAVLNLVPAERRDTLIAKKTAANQYEWNVVLRNEKAPASETVFFDCV